MTILGILPEKQRSDAGGQMSEDTKNNFITFIIWERSLAHALNLGSSGR